jgi:hypothetical protein
MVRLAPWLVADSVESYRVDHIDGESVEAIFDPSELDLGARRPAVDPVRPVGRSFGNGPWGSARSTSSSAP